MDKMNKMKGCQLSVDSYPRSAEGSKPKADR